MFRELPPLSFPIHSWKISTQNSNNLLLFRYGVSYSILVHFSSPFFPSINSSFTLAFRLYNCQAAFCWDVRFSLELPKLQEEFTKPPTPAYTKLNYQQIECREILRSFIPGNLMVNYHPN